MTWATRLVETARGTFEVFVKGEGAPLCITHLYSEYNDSGDRLADVFTDRFQVFLVNLRDAGNSVKSTDVRELDFDETVKDVEAIREALGFASWTFAGHSMGGMLGVQYAVDAGDSLDALVTVGSAASWHYGEAEGCIYNPQHPRFQYMQDLLIRLQVQDLDPTERSRLQVERAKLSLFDPNRYDELFSGPSHKKTSAIRLAHVSRDGLRRFDLRAQLPTIRTRTLILCGLHDVQCPPSVSQEMHEGIPGSTLVLFPVSNHYPFLEEPFAFREALDAFFA